MPKTKKTVTYMVRATRGIINEMVRYEGATIKSIELFDNRGELMVARRGADIGSGDQWNVYQAIIESQECAVGRWKSFMVTPTILS